MMGQIEDAPLFSKGQELVMSVEVHAGFSMWGELKFLSNWGIFKIPTNNCENNSVHFSAIFYELAPMLSPYYLDHSKFKNIRNETLEASTFFSRNLWFSPIMVLIQVPGNGWDLVLDFQPPDHIFNLQISV
jgi:hypothetical protein